MAYDRYDRDRHDRYGRDQDRDRFQDRGFFDRAGDEVRSWFGDEDAERRRRIDERTDGRADRSGYGPGLYRNPYDRGYSGEPRSNRDEGDRGYGRPTGYGYRADHDHPPRDAYGDHGHDDGYRQWRDGQIESFDRDYAEYRRENQARFQSEFAAWRQTRQTQRASLGQVKEHQEVVGSDGGHVGTVDHVRADHILLTKADPAAGGHHHSIPSSWVAAVTDTVQLSKTADEARRHWRDAGERSPFGGERDDRPAGRGKLDRSFPGTY